MFIINLVLCAALSLEAYRFEHGSTEIWYQISISDIFSRDSIFSNMRFGQDHLRFGIIIQKATTCFSAT